MAAEATSVGMRYPGVAAVLWALVGMGWACGAEAGGFRRLVRWSGPVGHIWNRHGVRVAGGLGGLAASLVILVLAWQSVLASGYLYRAKRDWDGRQYEQAATLLAKEPCVPAADSWMTWKYLQGRTNLALSWEARTNTAARSLQAKALDARGCAGGGLSGV